MIKVAPLSLPLSLLASSLLLSLVACTSAPPLPGPEILIPETGSMTPLAAQVYSLTNAVRAQGVRCQGAEYPASPALTEDRTLNAAAQYRADDLATTEDFTHSPADGKGYSYWLDRVHFTAAFNYKSVGENLGMGDTPEIIIGAWKASAVGHCEAQFTGSYIDSQSHQSQPGFTRVGMGEAVSRVSGKHYWTVIFAN